MSIDSHSSLNFATFNLLFHFPSIHSFIPSSVSLFGSGANSLTQHTHSLFSVGMDQSDLLNDLLLTIECGICLEQLESTSKVLPSCGHTFCVSCLNTLVRSQQKLVCPECRTLVEIPVQELPSNVLLNRLLEGIKKTTSDGRRCSTPRSSFRIGEQVFSDHQKQCDGQLRNERLLLSSHQSTSPKYVRAKALSSYDGRGSPK